MRRLLLYREAQTYCLSVVEIQVELRAAVSVTF